MEQTLVEAARAVWSLLTNIDHRLDQIDRRLASLESGGRSESPGRVTTLLSPRDAGQFLGIADSTLAQWRLRGGGPKYVKVGKRIRYPRAELDAFVEKQTRMNTSDSGPEQRTMQAKKR